MSFVLEGLAILLKREVVAFRKVTANWLIALFDTETLGFRIVVRHCRLHVRAEFESADVCTIVLIRDRVFGRFRHLVQLKHAPVMVREVEHINQVTELSTAPRIDFLRVESLTNGLGPFFQEHDLTFMCRMLSKDTTITRPRRDSVEGHAESWTCWYLALLLVIRIRHPLTLSVLRRQGGYNVVGQTACFII